MIKDRFFGRQYYIETLSKRINGLKDGYRQNIAFLGDEATGKTSVIMHFLSRLDDNMIIPVYLDVRPQIPALFFRRFLAALLYNFLRNSDTPLKGLRLGLFSSHLMARGSTGSHLCLVGAVVD